MRYGEENSDMHTLVKCGQHSRTDMFKIISSPSRKMSATARDTAKGKGGKRKSAQVPAHPVTTESVKEKKVIETFFVNLMICKL